MALSDSILLQISQKKTTYNDLLTKMLSNYSSSGSAKAALSRALKNLIAFGDLEKDSDFYVLTEKGKITVESKLKNKILININDLLDKSKKRNSLEFVDDIISNLQIFLERGKQDPSLLKIGKTSSTFYIYDLINLKKEMDTSVNHYLHLSNVLTNQINILQEKNFEDMLIINLDSNIFEIIKFLYEKYNIEEIILECSKEYPETIKLFEETDGIFKKTDLSFKINIKDIDLLAKKLLDNFEITILVKFKIYINEILISFSFGKVYLFGPFNLINEIKEKREEYLQKSEKLWK